MLSVCHAAGVKALPPSVHHGVSSARPRSVDAVFPSAPTPSADAAGVEVPLCQLTLQLHLRRLRPPELPLSPHRLRLLTLPLHPPRPRPLALRMCGAASAQSLPLRTI